MLKQYTSGKNHDCKPADAITNSRMAKWCYTVTVLGGSVFCSDGGVMKRHEY